MNIRVGITGAGGFLGGHISRALAAHGGASISKCDVSKGCNLIDPRAAERFVCDKDVIIHAAAVSRGSDADIIAGSVVATWNLLSAAAALKKKPKIIFFSSIHAASFDNTYGISKKLTEVMLEDFAKRLGVPVSIFRLTNVFGEGSKPFYTSVVATFCYQLSHGKKPTVSPLARKVTFIYVGDVVRLIAREVFTKRRGKFYFKHVASKNQITVPQLAALLQKLSSMKNESELKSKFERDLYRTYKSYTKA
ncbi:MAG: NAD-dependent epimerase/dehydratase family protein [Candidatus Jorgensenbacteria bacterium]|nr:NAD-dependent epimerase/dehydratase family protein [Candidatus Jorgensenbacteria bacterium]